jgi:hypothetical protein
VLSIRESGYGLVTGMKSGWEVSVRLIRGGYAPRPAYSPEVSRALGWMGAAESMAPGTAALYSTLPAAVKAPAADTAAEDRLIKVSRAFLPVFMKITITGNTTT